ncbi:hypothetical protein [Nitrosomonas sp.]|uniref:hypothetical protein n=1 Tax=Nitrosomonas sp. TaxID=42353 RepID=UPI002089E420|nr:hypothetical protein [Nitrosomonas sp.]GJL76998.1 MAG: hypothetical protein NMNS02_31040 [Nitrosomonas sp.]
MNKIDWETLTKQPAADHKTIKAPPDNGCGAACPTRNTLNINECPTSPTCPTCPTGLKRERIISAPERGSTEKNARTEFHPIAVCLLLHVAKKIHCKDEEIFHELTRLETMLPIEQVQIWAGYAVENGIDPDEIIYPFTKSPGKGHDCMTCQHLEMTRTQQPGKKRKLYQWQCSKQHQMLEAYYLRERVLIAPDECTDYQHV